MAPLLRGRYRPILGPWSDSPRSIEGLLRPRRARRGPQEFYFSVTSKDATGTGFFQGGVSSSCSGRAGSKEAMRRARASSRFRRGRRQARPIALLRGVWEANKAVSFTSYGVANERAEGRLPVLKVTLHFDGGTVLSTATLTAACRLGSPPATAKEGRDPQRGVDVQPRHPCHGYHDLWRSAPGLRPLRFDILEIGETWFVRSGDLKRT